MRFYVEWMLALGLSVVVLRGWQWLQELARALGFQW